MANPAQTATATYTVALRDEISATAKSAVGALDALKAKMAEETKQVGELQRAMSRLKAAGLGKSESYKQLQDQLSAVRASIGRNQESFVKLGGSFRQTTPAARSLIEQLSGAPGPLGAAASRVGALGTALGTTAGTAALVVVGIAAVVAVLAAVTTGAIAAAAAFTSYAISVADARRNELLHLEGLTSIRNWMGIAAGSARELQQIIDGVSDSTSLGRESVMRYAEQLYRAGLRGGTLETALEGVTMTAAVQGDAWAQRFAGMAISAARTGRSVDDLTERVRGRLGGIAARQVLGLDAQMTRLRRGVASLFDGLDIEPFLGALSEITGMFSQSTVTGRALQTIITTLFQPLLGSAGDARNSIRTFIEEGVILALRLTLAFLDVRNAVTGMIPRSARDGVREFFTSGQAGTVAFRTVVGGLAAAFTLASASVFAALGPVFMMGAAAFAVGSAIGSLITHGIELYRWFSDADWSGLGRSLVDGLVNGLTSGRDVLVSAVRGLADTATTTLRDLLQIRSPSRVFAALGLEIPRGLAVGVESGVPLASSAVSSMSEGAEASFADTASEGGRTTNTSTTSIGPIEIHVTGSNAQEIADSLRDQVTRLFEEIAHARGGALA